MKYLSATICLLIFFICIVAPNSLAQDLTVTPNDTVKAGAAGSEVVFDISVRNNTAGDLAVYIVRTNNNLPSNWTTALCFDFCFASFVDSVATTSDFGSSPLTSGETRTVQLHVVTDSAVSGTAYVGLKIGSLRNPLQFTVVNLQASAPLTAVESDEVSEEQNRFYGNYPNPFGASGSTIKVELKETAPAGVVLYNPLGKAVKTIYDGVLEKGIHHIKFEADDIPSGIYFYRVTIGSSSFTAKTLLLK